MSNYAFAEWSRYVSIRPEVFSLFKKRESLCGYVDPPIVIRCDGVHFGKRLRGFKFPRDKRVHEALLDAVESYMKVYGSDVALVISDEVNILALHPPYSGRVLKLSSTTASYLSSRVSLALRRPLSFDGRVISVKVGEVVPYFLLRIRIGLNNYISKLYRRYSEPVNTPSLQRMLTYLKEVKGLSGVEVWEGVGTLVVWSKVSKKGFNPLSGEEVEVSRRALIRKPAKINDVVSSLRKVMKHFDE